MTIGDWIGIGIIAILGVLTLIILVGIVYILVVPDALAPAEPVDEPITPLASAHNLEGLPADPRDLLSPTAHADLQSDLTAMATNRRRIEVEHRNDPIS